MADVIDSVGWPVVEAEYKLGEILLATGIGEKISDNYRIKYV
jgi:hypothetical protein